MQPFKDPRTDALLFPIPQSAAISLQRDRSCAAPSGAVIPFDVYAPMGVSEGRNGAPVVLFVHGDAPPDRLQGAKDWPQYTSWARLVAASGLAAVTFNRRSTEAFTRLPEAEAEVEAMLAHIHLRGSDYGLDGERIGVCAFSAGPPTVVPLVLRERLSFVRCIGVYYGVLDLRPPSGGPSVPSLPESTRAYSAAALVEDLTDTQVVPPLLVLRGGRDRPAINENLDRFVASALARNVAVEVFNHPDGDHAFDIRNDGARTREAIARTIEFFRWHLRA